MVKALFGGYAASGIGVVYIGSAASTTDSSSYNHGNFNAPTAGLMVVVQGGGRDAIGREVSSISIGGSNGTLIEPGNGDQLASIAYREVSAGNNNVTVTYSATAERDVVNVFLLTKYRSATPTSSTAVDGWSDSSRDMTLTIPVGGVAIYGATHQDSGAVSWSSATEVYDQKQENHRIAAAYLTGTYGAHTETATFTAYNEGAVAFACWR